jgi:hypothetical protein
MSGVTDGLGKKIDQGIFETVVALNALGIDTTGSCEGHINWGIAAPWVDIDPPGDVETLRDQMRVVSKEEARKISDHLGIKQCILFQSISKLLDQFYGQSRGHIPYDRMIIPHPWAAGRIRLESIGLETQAIVPDEIKAQKLQVYQAEMHDFTTFLKSLL